MENFPMYKFPFKGSYGDSVGHQSSNEGRPHFIIGLERFFSRYRKKLVWVHLIMLGLFVALVFVPPFLPVPSARADYTNNFSLFANFVLWGVWFPLVLVSVLFTGRSWCGLFCPMGASSEWANRIGLKRSPPAWLRWKGTPVISFLLVTIWGQTISIRDFSDSAAIVFGSLMGGALTIGFLYGGSGGAAKRPWCRHMCPIGLLLGIFSRLGPIQFTPKRPKQGSPDPWTEKGICPTFIEISRKAESRHCIECFRCVQPESKGGLFLKWRRPGTEVGNIRDFHPNAAEVWFLFLGTGTALGGFLWLTLPFYNRLRDTIGAWLIQQGYLWIGNPGPFWLMSVHPDQREVFNWLDFFSITGFMLVVTLALGALLAITTAVSSLISAGMGGDQSFDERFVELGYQFAPVAMVSLLIGLGNKFFSVSEEAVNFNWAIQGLKGILLFGGVLWSLFLANRILARQGVKPVWRCPPLLCGILGSLGVAIAWWPAIFEV